MIKYTILDTINKYNLINPNDVIVVAVSGGPDSMCLLDNLIQLQEQLKIKKIVVAHVNHMIREESKGETEYVKKYCKEKNIECFVKFVNVTEEAEKQKIGTEEAGRKARYKFFDEVAQKINANKIAVAHNQNDNAETILMHLLRGSGISGLCGIKPYREEKFIRPLIKCSRDEIEKYCVENKLEPRYDKSNEDNIYTRNKIRNQLIPYIKKEFNPNIIETLDRLSELVSEEEEYMDKVTNKVAKELIIEETKEKIIVDLKKFNLLEYVIKTRLILYITKEIFGSSKGLEKKHVKDIIKLCGNNIGNKYLTPNKNFKITIKNKKIYFEKVLK